MLSTVSYLRRLVVVRPDNKLGETLLATPVYRALREALPEATIEAWVPRRWSDVVAGSRRLNRILGISERPKRREFLLLLRKLRHFRPDAMLILRPERGTFAFMGLIAGIRNRAGTPLQNTSGRWLTHKAVPSLRAHQVEWNLSVAEALLGRHLPRYPMEYTPSENAPCHDFLSSMPPQSYAVLHFSTGGVQPRWLPQRFAQLSDWLRERFGLTPVWTAAPGDETFAAQVALHTRCSSFNWAGKLTIREVAEVLRNSRILISVDTGVVHLAAALRIPCISLHFRRDFPAYRWHAWQTPTIAVSAPLHCAECTAMECKIKSASDQICVQSITTDQVMLAVESLLKVVY